MRTTLSKIAFVLVIATLILSACAPKTPVATQPPATDAPATEAPATEAPTAAPTEAPAEPFIFGMILVGPYNDHGWSQAHYEAGMYVEELTGAKMIYLENVYDGSPDHPGTTTSQLGEELVAQGAKLVIFNSDAHQEEAIKFAEENPEIYTILASGDSAWKDGKNFKDIPNLVNIMGGMEYGKMMAGCAAALGTSSGQIGYLGPLINDETRRYAASAYLGAKYCWTEYLGLNPEDLKFKVTWIGFWFNIPGFTSDPTQVANDFINQGYDVIISGIDTTEGLTEAKKSTAAGKQVLAIPYDYIGSCEEGAEVCLGVPYFNWGPSYLINIKAAMDGTLAAHFELNNPDWADINNKEVSAVGFVKGAALSADASASLDEFIAALAGGLNLWKGPLNLQDGTQYLADGVEATLQEIWYLPQLLEGMEGQSVSE
jgi:simple sugar transport system substrate-binding protein